MDSENSVTLENTLAIAKAPIDAIEKAAKEAIKNAESFYLAGRFFQEVGFRPGANVGPDTVAQITGFTKTPQEIVDLPPMPMIDFLLAIGDFEEVYEPHFSMPEGGKNRYIKLKRDFGVNVPYNEFGTGNNFHIRKQGFYRLYEKYTRLSKEQKYKVLKQFTTILEDFASNGYDYMQ